MKEQKKAKVLLPRVQSVMVAVCSGGIGSFGGTAVS